MKKSNAIDFLTVTLFFGVLVSFMIYLGLGMFIGTDPWEEEGSVDRGVGFNDMFYDDQLIDGLVRYFDYTLFGHIASSDIMIGDENWLFEATDSTNGYQRLLDYVGGCEFSTDELERMSALLAGRAESYEEAGIQYMMMVIPDAITICSDKVPSYLGRQSENTRLRQLSRYMAENSYFIDPTSILLAENGDLPMYNNTENSINAYGAYCLYNLSVSRFLAGTGIGVERILYDDVEFFVRLTEGKTIAMRAGLEETIQNRTVSLSDSMAERYTVTSNEKGLVITSLTGNKGDGLTVIVECADEWDRIQLTPFFSNTFENVYYKSELSEDATAAVSENAAMVVQIIHESELVKLLEQ